MTRRNVRWVPDQHGAWAMITIPALIGVAIGGPSWRHLPLLGSWWLGYFLYHSLSLWLKSRRRARNWPPVRAYALLTAPLLLATIVSTPHLIGWGLYFCPLFAISVWCIANRKERSLTNDAVTIIAACLMTMVAFDAARVPDYFAAGVAFDPTGIFTSDRTELTESWRAFAALTAYFLGTIGHVKSLIRERNNPRFWAGSIGYHAVALAIAIGATTTGAWPGKLSSSLLLTAAVIALARAVLLPLIARRRGRLIPPKQIGLLELGLSALMAIAVLTS